MKRTSLHIGSLAVGLLNLVAFQAVGQAPQLEGKRTHHTYTAKKYNPGAVFEYTVYLSKYCKPDTPAALLVQFDFFNEQQTAAMEKLAGEGLAPPFVVIAAPSGKLEPTIEGGTTRGLRVENYDHIGPEFPSFLAEELIPEATKVENLSISPNPDLHITSVRIVGRVCRLQCLLVSQRLFPKG